MSLVVSNYRRLEINEFIHHADGRIELKMDDETLARRKEATAKFHDRMARAFESVGKTTDAESAKRAAAGLRKS